MIGKKISPILVEIEETLWEFEANTPSPPEYTEKGFRASLKIAMSAIMDKMWELQTDEDIDLNIRIAMADKVGNEFRQLVKTYTNIDTHDLYK